MPTKPPREEILEAAGRLFAERGYAGTSTGDIAEAVGLTQPAIFYYFTSKEYLFCELAKEAIVKPLAHLEKMLASDASPAARLYLQIVFHVTHDLSSPFSLSAVVEDARRLPNTGALDDVWKKDRRYSRGIRELITDAIAVGQFRETEPLLASMAVLGMSNWALRWYRAGGRLRPRDVAEHFADFSLRSLLADPADLDAVRAEAAELGAPKRPATARR